MSRRPTLPVTPQRLAAYRALLASGLSAGIASRLIGLSCEMESPCK